METQASYLDIFSTAVLVVPDSRIKRTQIYPLSSLPVDSERFVTFVRNHWDMENAGHWSLDVAYDEDQSRARTKNAAANLRTIRSVAMNILSACKQRFCPKFTMKKLGVKMGLFPAYLYEVLGINLGEI